MQRWNSQLGLKRINNKIPGEDNIIADALKTRPSSIHLFEIFKHNRL